MIGGLTSSLALAQRTADKARATMDTMSRQIATGQRVSSVKDDGAAWARAAALKSQKGQAEVRADFHIANLRYVAESQSAMDEALRSTFDRMAGLLQQAMPLPAGSAARLQIASAWQQELANLSNIRTPNGAIESGLGMQADGRWGIVGPAADTMLAGRTIWTNLGASATDSGWETGDWASNGMPYGSVNVLTANQTQLASALQTVRQFNDVNLLHATQLNGRRLQWLDSVESYSRAEAARLDTAIGALTDADLGKASTARAQAETRQQLALATVRQALDAYGNYAGGLLGNVQRTQRSIMA